MGLRTLFREHLCLVDVLHRLQQQAKGPVAIVLGGIPTLRPQFQPSALSLSKELLQMCPDCETYYIPPLHEILHAVPFDGCLTHQGRMCTLEESSLDELYLAMSGSEYLVDRILKWIDMSSYLPHWCFHFTVFALSAFNIRAVFLSFYCTGNAIVFRTGKGFI